jgi:hypothetical protein
VLPNHGVSQDYNAAQLDISKSSSNETESNILLIKRSVAEAKFGERLSDNDVIGKHFSYLNALCVCRLCAEEGERSYS